MINIYDLLKENGDISGWKVNENKTESYELFFVHKDLETVRVTDTETVTVTVYCDHDEKKGNASFKLYASTTEKEAKEKIADAAKKAALISNENYQLPKDERLIGEIPSNFDMANVKAQAKEIADAVMSADMLDFGSINALEIFINKHIVKVKNSEGIDKEETKYTAMVEAIPTWNEGESVELYEAMRFNTLDTEKIKEEIEQKMREVRDRGKANKPNEALSCPVLLPAEELQYLFSELAYGLNYANVYTHSNPHSVGDKIQKEPRYDKISVTMKGMVEGSTASALFDDDGTTLKDIEIIKDGVASAYFGTSRFAQYVGMEATGGLNCQEIKTGTLTNDELISAPYFECVSMSGLQLDIFNDYIGGEVRLAYYFDGKNKIPMTGISLSGKLSDAINSIRLSKDKTTVGRYCGPKFALLEGIAIV